MSFISVFDVLGPNMVGPSSSHTAGAAVIAALAGKLIAPPIKKVDFTLYGSFAKTYRGHGTDRALLGGILGHPNTADIHMQHAAGQEMTVRGVSLGGGKVKITRINGVDVDFTGEYSALIVVHKDTPGVVAHITHVLSEHNVNIAFMRLFREAKGHTAYTIIESDGTLPHAIPEQLRKNLNIRDVMLVQP